MLYKINTLLPNIYRINIPSLSTNDYGDTVLFQVKKYAFVVNNNMLCVIIVKRSFLCGSLTRK